MLRVMHAVQHIQVLHTSVTVSGASVWCKCVNPTHFHRGSSTRSLIRRPAHGAGMTWRWTEPEHGIHSSQRWRGPRSVNSGGALPTVRLQLDWVTGAGEGGEEFGVILGKGGGMWAQGNFVATTPVLRSQGQAPCSAAVAWVHSDDPVRRSSRRRAAASRTHLTCNTTPHM